MKSFTRILVRFRDDIDRAECSVSQLKLRNDSEPTDPDSRLGLYRRECQPLEQLSSCRGNDAHGFSTPHAFTRRKIRRSPLHCNSACAAPLGTPTVLASRPSGLC